MISIGSSESWETIVMRFTQIPRIPAGGNSETEVGIARSLCIVPTSSTPVSSGTVLETSLFAKAMQLPTYSLVVGESNWAITSIKLDQMLAEEYPEEDEAVLNDS